LVQTEFVRRVLDPGGRTGLDRFLDWMPCETLPADAGGPVSFRSAALEKQLGLKQLVVSFNGFWPERGATCRSGTFKEYEARVTLERLRELGQGQLVLASAGNTGRAFAQLFNGSGVRLILAVPQSSAKDIWLCTPECSELTVLAVRDGDYFDAIQMADRICQLTGYLPEGGARNIARRAGLSLPVMDAVLTFGDIPAYYFQAVGSGTGGIAAQEAVVRFVATGQYRNRQMQLHLVQNDPFIPMVNAYRRGSRTIDPVVDMADAAAVMSVCARMLTNRRPPYSIVGGVFDVLQASHGQMWAVTNDEARAAQALFAACEGVDIEPEAGVALAALRNAVAEGAVAREAMVLLNVTGGGVQRLKRDQPVREAPHTVVERNITDAELRALAHIVHRPTSCDGHGGR
jgi:cysteate synthase